MTVIDIFVQNFGLKKESISYGILKFKCPRCHEGDLFTHSNHYDLGNFLKMHKNCPVCNQTYTPEPGFYFGAAYISYAVSVAIAVIAALITLALGYRAPGTIIGAILIPTVLLAPINFRLSRSIWANIFIKYKGVPKKEVQS